jgi:hypothetical protein
VSPYRLPLDPLDELDARRHRSLSEPASRVLLYLLTRPEIERAALIHRLRLHDGTAWLAALLSDLEADAAAWLHLVEQLRIAS